MTIEAQIRELLNNYAESRILIRQLMSEGYSDRDGPVRLAGAAVHLTDTCVTEIMATVAFELAEERQGAATEMYKHWRT